MSYAKTGRNPNPSGCEHDLIFVDVIKSGGDQTGSERVLVQKCPDKKRKQRHRARMPCEDAEKQTQREDGIGKMKV